MFLTSITSSIKRFASSNNPTIPPPFFQAPYRATGEYIVTGEEKDIEIPFLPPTMEEVREQRVKDLAEAEKQREMIQRFTDLKTKLERINIQRLTPFTDEIVLE
jgi:hypothetical protein